MFNNKKNIERYNSVYHNVTKMINHILQLNIAYVLLKPFHHLCFIQISPLNVIMNVMTDE